MARVLRPGPATVVGLRWLAAVGPVSVDAWATAMGWGRTATYGHASRLVDAGWAQRQSMTRGQGTLLYATRDGVAVCGAPAVALAGAPAPTTWAHWSACGWVAAWLSRRGRHIIGARELLASDEWHGQLRWSEQGAPRTRGHRPDLLTSMSHDGPLIPVEVELATKASQRLHAVLALHARWINSDHARALMYVCGTEYLADRVREHAHAHGLSETRRTLRIEQLTAITHAAQQPGAPAAAQRAA
jgi:hypothetical protein